MVKRGKGYFQNLGGSWLKRVVTKFRGVWTLDEAMQYHATEFQQILDKYQSLVFIEYNFIFISYNL